MTYDMETSNNKRTWICLNPVLAERVRKYCHLADRNMTMFIETCVGEALDRLEKEQYLSMSKGELIDLLLEQRKIERGQ